MAGKSEVGAAGLETAGTLHPQLGSGKQGMFMLTSISPFYSVQDLIPGDGATHSEWVFPSQ